MYCIVLLSVIARLPYNEKQNGSGCQEMGKWENTGRNRGEKKYIIRMYYVIKTTLKKKVTSYKFKEILQKYKEMLS